MCARFTVLSDTPSAAAIAGCVIPLSRNSTIWMRWRCAGGIFHRSAVSSLRTSALLHFTICSPESDGAANHTPWKMKTISPSVAAPYLPKTRFKPFWRWYKPSYAEDDYLYEHLAEQAKVRAAYVDIVRDDLEYIA